MADNLMEPFRPWVDYIVYQMLDLGKEAQINQESKKELLGILSASVIWEDKTQPLMVASHYLTATLKRAYKDKQVKLTTY